MGATARCLGEAIRAARTNAGLTLRGLERATHGRFRPSAVGGYERGERDISVERLVDLAYALHTSPEELIADAMRRLSPRAHVEVAIDLHALGEQGDTAAVRAVRAFTHATQLRRNDLMGDVITIRAGDLEVIAREAGIDVPALLHGIGGGIRRVGPS